MTQDSPIAIGYVRVSTEEQAAEWKTITQALPADWIKTYAQPLLAELCCHIVASKHVRQLISTAEADPDMSIANYDRLLKMFERESRAIASLSVKLRLSPSTEYRKETKKDLIGDRAWSIRDTSRNRDKLD